jgi:histidine triad (HIT) family protein
MSTPTPPPTGTTPPATDCLFCKIRDGAIPAAITYSDDRVLAFKDIGPKAPLHQLVIPREHVGMLSDVDAAHEALLGHMMVTAAHIAREAGYAAPDTGFRVVMNSGAGAGQSVFHIHLHVLGGRAFGWPPG